MCLGRQSFKFYLGDICVTFLHKTDYKDFHISSMVENKYDFHQHYKIQLLFNTAQTCPDQRNVPNCPWQNGLLELNQLDVECLIRKS